jgi:DNA-binding transcriptional LysR family regulator
MRLTLRQLQIFIAIAQSGSTAAAAQLVSLSQSASSAALNELEGLLECRLFDRVGKRLILNENGRVLLPQARQMLDVGATIEKQFSLANGTATGLHIGASTTIGIYLLPTILATSDKGPLHKHPRVTIANTSDIISAVASFEVDVGLIEGPCHDQEVHVEPWLRDELIIVSGPKHPILAGKNRGKVSLKALREAEWLLREPGSGTREAVEHALVPQLHKLHMAAEFSNSEAIKHAAAEGLGIACLSRSVVADFVSLGRLVELDTPLPALNRYFFLIHNKRKVISTSLGSFLELCRRICPNGS